MTKTKLPPREHFVAYERIRRCGRLNMITEARHAARDAGLLLDEYLAVLKNYEALMKKYPEVRGATTQTKGAAAK